MTYPMQGTLPQALGTGASPTFAGITVTGAAIFASTVSITGDLTLAAAAKVKWTGRSIVESPANGHVLFTNAAGTAGVLADVSVDGTIKFRNRANSADAALTCAGITVSGNVDLDSDTALLRLGTNQDVILAWDAANVLAQRNGGSAASPVPQTFRLYNFSVNPASDYERLSIYWGANTAVIKVENAGTGSARDLIVGSEGGSLYVRTNGASRWQFATAGHQIPVAPASYDFGTTSARIRSLYLGGNTPTDSLPIIDGLQTWNDVTKTFIGLDFQFIDSNSAAASVLLRIRGGALGTANKFYITKDGAVYAAGSLVSTGGSLELPDAGVVLFGSRGRMKAAADGVFQMVDNATTDFTALDLAGASAELRINGTKVVDAQGAAVADAAAPTVGADIGAFTDPPTAAEMATLRTFVNALKADYAAGRTQWNALLARIRAHGLIAT